MTDIQLPPASLENKALRTPDTADFFAKLPPLLSFSDVLIEKNYHELPDDWWLVVTDLQGSTRAIEEGRYRDINALGGCTVAAVLNAVKPLNIPYVFGGDGASFCIPACAVEAVRKALRGCIELADEHFDLKLRAGLLPYTQLKPLAPLLVCCYHRSPGFEQAIFAGGGLLEADRLVKQDDAFHVRVEEGQAEADFSGFECRWNRVPSPQEITVSLLVEVTSTDLQQQLRVYQLLMQQMQVLFGEDEQQQPLTVTGLQLSFSSEKLAAEAHARSYSEKRQSFSLNLWKIRLFNFLGLLLMGLKIRIGKADWGRYKQDALLNSDYRKLDGMFRSVFAARHQTLEVFTQWLEQQRQQGVLKYGIHVSDAAQVTCLVSQAGVKHIHFVDGCDGGYALAAKALKQQGSAF